MQVLLFQFENLHIIEGRQGIQLLPTFLESSECLLVGKRQLPEVGINGMQGMDADGIVGIAVRKGALLRGVIDGQELNGVHSGLCCPVGHLLEVAEVTNPLTALCAEREERHHKACHLPMRHREPYLTIGKGNDPLTIDY